MMEYTQLETNRLLLREFEFEDLDFVFRHFKDPFVSKFLYDNEPPRNRDEAREILNWCLDSGSDHLRWCIVLKNTAKPIGTIGFHRYDQNNNAAEIGFDLYGNYARQGLMTEALQCLLNYGAGKLALHRIYASVAVENTASNRLLESNGFRLEGTLRDQYLFRGEYYDHNLWAYIAG